MIGWQLAFSDYHSANWAGVRRSEMTNVASPARGLSPGRMAAVIVLAVIAIVAIVATIMYFTEPAKSLPSILGTITHPASRANAHRSTRGLITLIVGVVCLAAAGAAIMMGRKTSAR
jgi:hypothetical protein